MNKLPIPVIQGKCIQCITPLDITEACIHLSTGWQDILLPLQESGICDKCYDAMNDMAEVHSMLHPL